MSWLGNFFTGNNSSSTSTSSTTSVTGGTYAGVGQTTPSTLPYTIPTTHTVGTVGVATGGGGGTYVSPSMGVYNPNQTTTISTGYSTYPNVGTIHIAGTNPTISTDKGKLELNALIELVDTLKERLLILTPNFEKMEKYAALKKAYDHYKLMESMIGDEDVNKK